MGGGASTAKGSEAKVEKSVENEKATSKEYKSPQIEEQRPTTSSTRDKAVGDKVSEKKAFLSPSNIGESPEAKLANNKLKRLVS